MSDGPASASVAHINNHSEQHFEGRLRCHWADQKGRILLSTREFAVGEIILVEGPLHIAQEDKRSGAWKKLNKLCKDYEDDFEYEALWYWCALRSLSGDQLKGVKAIGLEGAASETQFNLLLLHHPKVTEASESAQILVRELVPNADVMILERLIQIWVLNCFEYSDSPQGYATYFFSSFMSHSCYPNAIWHYDGANHVVRARRNIAVGEEVCISYLPEDGLLQAVPVRRWELHETKQFWCDCERCTGDRDYSRGFSCPSCKDGKVFAFVPKSGPAEAATLLATELVGADCLKCGQKLSADVAEELNREEVALKTLLDDLSGDDPRKELTNKEALTLEAHIGKFFAQHILADLVCEQIANFYEANERRADQRRMIERRIVFHKGAYPGLSGSHAWTIENLADALMVPEKGKTVPASQRVRAAELFADALEILRLLFGNEHEYVTLVVDKLNSELELGNGGCGPAAAKRTA
eukprot:TRINITY_DN1036_c0_g1_i1.p1 TRINITY_DN1036_c0_g1~~TRINITY_DN1036_c0_g1_i1.p1  ORF type:complete len:470 (+),score=69.09 TRINITY_DN1036_c0_g1_i1:105-1514(+)